MRSYDIVFFDFDGTLVDTIPDIAFHANAVLEHLGSRPRSIEEVRAAVGKGMHQLLRELCPKLGTDPEALSQAALLLKRFYAERPVVHSCLYEGVREALSVPGGPVKIVLTNKLAILADAILCHFEIRDRFDEVIGDGGGYPLKPDPTAILSALRRYGVPLDRALLIGDSHVDQKAAQAANVQFGWAAYGYECVPQDTVSVTRFDSPRDWAPLIAP